MRKLAAEPTPENINNYYYVGQDDKARLITNLDGYQHATRRTQDVVRAGQDAALYVRKWYYRTTSGIACVDIRHNMYVA